MFKVFKVFIFFLLFVFLITYEIISDNVDAAEAKSFLEANYSAVFYVFYESFIIFEGNLRQKGIKYMFEFLADHFKGKLTILTISVLLFSSRNICCSKKPP